MINRQSQFVQLTDLGGEASSLAVMVNHLVTVQVAIVNDITLQYPEKGWVGVAQHSRLHNQTVP